MHAHPTKIQRRGNKSMNEQVNNLRSSALQVNLKATAAAVEIPSKYDVLLRTVESHYGVHKKARELLLELHHPYVNWEYVMGALKNLSVGDFYEINTHPEGLPALNVIMGIYFDVIRSAGEDVKETAVRYLFDFMDTVVSKSREFLPRNLALLPPLFDNLFEASSAQKLLFRKSSTYVKPFLRSALSQGADLTGGPLGGFLHNVFGATYRFWLSQPDPLRWLAHNDESLEGAATYRELIKPLSHAELEKLLEELNPLSTGNGEVSAYIGMPDYFQIVNGYLLIADDLERSPVFAGRQHLVKLDFLFNIINVAGLSDVHGTALREINHCLGMVFSEKDPSGLHEFVRNIFDLLKKSGSRQQYPSTIIDCISTIAREVFNQKNHALVDTFINELISFGFQYPEVRGSTTEWQVEVNPAHVKNIRCWLEIIGLRPRWTKRLLSALIINLKLGGVFVRDTDLLQRDISAFLNSDIAPAYNLSKQILRMFPVYFSEIGAEGELRDISTRVDEVSRRNDKLIYFLRKQSHVESNSLLVGFIEDIFRYWYTGEREHLRKHLPDEVFEQVPGNGEYFEGMHTLFKKLFETVGAGPFQFLSWDKAKIQREIHSARRVSERDRERAGLMIRLYQLLYKKYHPQHLDLLKELEAAHIFDSEKLRALKRSLTSQEHYKSLVVILGFLSTLKERILSPTKTTFFENIYYKRHIAAGIPSMYGTYREEKLEAVGLSLRLESLATTLFEEMIAQLNLKFVTRSTLTKIHKYLWLYVKALDLEGIATEGLVAKIKYVTSALQIKDFSIDQYLDIFQFISKGIQNVIRDYYIDAHGSNLPVIIGQIYQKTAGDDTQGRGEETIYQHSENFIRSMIASAFGLQVLDTFVNSILRTLGAEMERFKSNRRLLNLVMAYDPDLTISPIHRRNEKLDNQILIGNKGYFLKQLASFGFPIPPGFILTTEVFRAHDAVVGYKYITNDLSVRIGNEIKKLEKAAGGTFGDPSNPLLLSVRSGATISLPGMMHSFLNVGINPAVAEGLSQRPEFAWAAWDCYRRFLQMWGMFQGLDRDYFDKIMDSFKRRYNVSRKIQFVPEQMRQVALAYREALEKSGIAVTDHPPDQLRHAIMEVFASWHSEQANIYRHQMHLSDEWGTAVIVQAMVFGNLNRDSGSGVIFTRDPKGISREVTLFGDFIFGVQGDDIVSGLVETFPISEKQRVMERRDSAISLETRFPEIYRELVRLSEVLIYERGFNHQEIEFTFENSTKTGLHILQTRDMAQLDGTRLKIFKDAGSLDASLIGSGIGVSGGALSGRAVYCDEEISRFRAEEPQTPLILIRPDTVPEDVGVLLNVDGILTAKGGATSHAAVTIPQLNKVGVVGFSKLRVYEAERYSKISGRVINGGDFISIDGWSGAVYIGKHETESAEPHRITI